MLFWSANVGCCCLGGEDAEEVLLEQSLLGRCSMELQGSFGACNMVLNVAVEPHVGLTLPKFGCEENQLELSAGWGESYFQIESCV